VIKFAIVFIFFFFTLVLFSEPKTNTLCEFNKFPRTASQSIQKAKGSTVLPADLPIVEIVSKTPGKSSFQKDPFFPNRAAHFHKKASEPLSIIRGPFVYLNSSTWALMEIKTQGILSQALIHYGATYTTLEHNQYLFPYTKLGIMDTTFDEKTWVEFKLDSLMPGQVIYFMLELTDQNSNAYYTSLWYFVSNNADLNTDSVKLLYEPITISQSDSMGVVFFISDIPAPGLIQLNEGSPENHILREYDYFHFVMIPESYPNRFLSPNTLYSYFPGHYFTALEGSGLNPVQLFTGKPFQFQTSPQTDIQKPTITFGPISFAYQDKAYVYLETDELTYTILYLWDTPEISIKEPIGSTSGLFIGKYQIFELPYLDPGKSYFYQIYILDQRGYIAWERFQQVLLTNLTIWPADDKISFSSKISYPLQPGCHYQPAGVGNNSFTTSAQADVTPPSVTDGPIVVDRGASQAIIQWTTDEASSVICFYATKEDLSDLCYKQDDKFLTEHWIGLSNLVPDQVYLFRLLIYDLNGNSQLMPDSTLPPFAFKTLSRNDENPPEIISSIQSLYLGNQTYQFEWETNLPANSQLSISLNQSYWQSYGEQKPITHHRIMVSSLDTDQLYYIKTYNSRFNHAAVQSPVSQFTATEKLDTNSLQFEVSPEIVYIGNTTVIFTCKTNALTSIVLDYSIDSTQWITVLDNPYNQFHRMIVSNLAPNQNYYTIFNAIDLYGNIISTHIEFKTVNTPDSSPPQKPSHILITPSASGIHLEWSASLETDLAGYCIYAGDDSTSMKKIMSAIIDTFFNDNTNNILGYYAVSAYDLKMNESELSYGLSLTGIRNNGALPWENSLQQNIPNPFNQSTFITYSLASSARVELCLYNILGQKLKILVNANQTAGVHSCKLDALDLTSGIYFIRMNTDQFSQAQKVLLLK